MILHDVTPRRPLPEHACGFAPHLIEARGRITTDPRLFGRPARSWHVECARCGVATHLQPSPGAAELAWQLQVDLVTATALPTLRVDAERALAAAA